MASLYYFVVTTTLVSTQNTTYTVSLFEILPVKIRSRSEPSDSFYSCLQYTKKMRNLWCSISEPSSKKEIVLLIFMLCLVTFSVILSQSKEKCSQGLSISNKHLLWLSSASLSALVFNYRTHVGHLLFASAATVNNICYTDYCTTQCFPFYPHQSHISSPCRVGPSSAQTQHQGLACL